MINRLETSLTRMVADPETIRRGIVGILPRLRRYAFALTGARDRGDDLLQSTLERVLEKGAPADADLLKWSMRICKNLWIDDIRTQNVRRAAAPALLAQQEVGADARRDVEERLTLNAALAALATLPPEQRATLTLVALEGLSYREAADILETPIGTVMSRVARARATLVAKLEGAASEDKEIGDEE